jgi:hypothetical protein
MSKVIKLPCFNIKVTLDEKNSDNSKKYIGGSIKTNLHEKCPICNKICYGECATNNDKEVEDPEELSHRLDFNNMMDALESIILAHACSGIDIESLAYIEGIETAVEACGNQTC